MSETHLHAGPDLANAAARSKLPPILSRQRSPLLRMPGALDSVLADALNAPVTRLRPATALITGAERLSGKPMSILFQGQLRSVDFCAEHILGTADFEYLPQASGQQRYDVIVTDHPFLDRGIFGSRPALRVPQWLRQHCRLGHAWEQTVANFPVPLRKRISRQLGRNSYTVRLETAASAKENFYEQLYLPYIKHRFGTSAIVASRRGFARDARDGILLQLWLDGKLLGATLVQHDGESLHLAKSALTLGHSVTHVFDLLDYFCFLLAQMTGCGDVNLGVSRPHIEDGVFANKSKWRPQLAVAGGFKPAIRIKPMNRSAATAGFLARNGFIERRGDEFVIRRLYCDEAPDATAAARSGETAARAGLDALVIAYCGTSEIPPSLDALAPHPQLHRLTGSADPLQSFLLHA